MKPHGTYDTAFQAGAASRDAEVSELRNLPLVKLLKDSEHRSDQLSYQVTLLRDALANIRKNAGRHFNIVWVEITSDEALAATTDLDGLILCDKDPVATGLFDYFGECHAVERNPKAAMGPGQLGRSKAPLYRAWEPK